MKDLTTHIVTFMLPLFIGNILHMLVVKGDYLHSTARPLSLRLFGSGKTYRGFIVLPLICGFFCLLSRSLLLHATDHWWSFCIGFILGVAYLVGELPNSFIKRRLGIQSGQQHAKYRLVQNIIDKSDSLLVACLVYFFITDISVGMTCILFAVSFIIHVFFSWLLVQIRVKRSF